MNHAEGGKGQNKKNSFRANRIISKMVSLFVTELETELVMGDTSKDNH